MRVGLENMTPARVYDVEIGLGDGDSWQLNGPTEPSPPGVRKTDVIEPGEIWWSTFDLIPDIETETAKIDIAQSLIRRRSEEHTSELQSLMRSSYAAFCLNKKMNITT